MAIDLMRTDLRKGSPVIEAKCNTAMSLGSQSLGPRVLGSLVLGSQVPGPVFIVLQLLQDL